MYSSVNSTKYGAAAIAYVESEVGHNNNDIRNQIIGYHNMLPGDIIPVVDQMEKLWAKADVRHMNQLIRLMISASPNELNPEEESNSYLLLAICKQVLENLEAETNEKLQAAIYIQKDGKGGKLHAHILINDCSLKHYGKRIDTRCHWGYSIRPLVNSTALEFIPELDTGTKKYRDNEDVNYIRENERYSWKDDIRDRIYQAAIDCNGDVSLINEMLKKNGVASTDKMSKKHGKCITYKLLDERLAKANHVRIHPKGLRIRDYNLGEEFSHQRIEDLIRMHQTEDSSEIDAGNKSEIAHSNDISVRTDAQDNIVSSIVSKVMSEPVKSEEELLRERKLKAFNKMMYELDVVYQRKIMSQYDNVPSYKEFHAIYRVERKRRKENKETEIELIYSDYDPNTDSYTPYPDAMLRQAKILLPLERDNAETLKNSRSEPEEGNVRDNITGEKESDEERFKRLKNDAEKRAWDELRVVYENDIMANYDYTPPFKEFRKWRTAENKRRVENGKERLPKIMGSYDAERDKVDTYPETMKHQAMEFIAAYAPKPEVEDTVELESEPKVDGSNAKKKLPHVDDLKAKMNRIREKSDKEKMKKVKKDFDITDD